MYLNAAQEIVIGEYYDVLQGGPIAGAAIVEGWKTRAQVPSNLHWRKDGGVWRCLCLGQCCCSEASSHQQSC